MGDEKPSHFGGRGAFEVPAEAPAPAEPCKGAFDDPTARQQLEAFDAVWPLDDLDRPRPAMGNGAGQLLATINPIGEHMSQLGKALSQAFQQGDRTMDILHVGGMDVDGQQKALGVGDDVPLAPVDAFTWIKAARSAGLRRGGALAVDDCNCWSRLASEFAASLSDQSSNDPVPPGGVHARHRSNPERSSTAGTRVEAPAIGSQWTG